MIKHGISFLVSIMLAAPTPSVANGTFKTGNELYGACKSSKESRFYGFEQTECHEFVTGLFDAYSTSFNIGSMKKTFCSPANVTVEQLKDVVVRYLELNPARRNLSAAVLALVAWKEAFPCEVSVK